MDVTLKIATISAIAVIIAALIKMLGALITKGSSRCPVVTIIVVILALLGSGAFVLFWRAPTSPTPSVSLMSTPTVVVPNADGLLAEIASRGTIVISTDSNFQPQSFLNPAGQRPTDTKCASDQLTSAVLKGFDIDVSNQIGARLGVEPCFVTPPFDAITSGNWGNKWDISVGSLRITPERVKVLAFTSPYYYENGETPLGIAIDYSNKLPINTLLASLSQIVDDMHKDGTLSQLSMQWFGKDLSKR